MLELQGSEVRTFSYIPTSPPSVDLRSLAAARTACLKEDKVKWYVPGNDL